LCLGFSSAVPVAVRADWPTYLHDNARSGVTDEKLKLPLVPIWTHRPVAPPDPAWTLPVKEAPRVRFDDVFHTVAADDRVYFGSSGDNKVYCLDGTTGKVIWSFFTDGPVRLAPTLADGRVYVGSDDGYVYCLDAMDGSEVWRQQVGYSPVSVTGHGRVISLWPVRTSVLIEQDTAYFGAGVFPSESVYLRAVNAADGTVVWRNDVSGERGPEQDRDGISPQGYLLASTDNLYVPSGRNMPAAYNRKNGEFLYYLSGGKTGGTYAILTDDKPASTTSSSMRAKPANAPRAAMPGPRRTRWWSRRGCRIR
jgi:outer membrane protein assembly factor BamB